MCRVMTTIWRNCSFNSWLNSMEHSSLSTFSSESPKINWKRWYYGAEKFLPIHVNVYSWQQASSLSLSLSFPLPPPSLWCSLCCVSLPPPSLSLPLSAHWFSFPGVVTVALLLIAVGSVLSSSMSPPLSFVLAVEEEDILPQTAWLTCKSNLPVDKILCLDLGSECSASWQLG